MKSGLQLLMGRRFLQVVNATYVGSLGVLFAINSAEAQYFAYDSNAAAYLPSFSRIVSWENGFTR